MSLATFWNEEGNWVSAVVSVLAGGGTGVPTANILPAQSVSFYSSPRIEVEIEEVARASEQMAYANGQWYYSHRSATVRVDVTTNRTAPTAQNHGTVRGRVRYLMSREAQSFVSPVVTNYVTLDIEETGSGVTVRDPEGDREDTTSLRFRIEYGVLPTAVPTL
jgi:hypothetical protein